jgi:integrase
MPRVVAPLTDMRVKNAKPAAKSYKLSDGGGLYLEVTSGGSKLWRMKFKQASGKESRLSFGTYPDVSLIQARAARAAARQLRATNIDPGQAKRDAKTAKAAAAAHTFEPLAREWLKKTAAQRAGSTQSKNTRWLEKNIFPEIGAMPISTIKPRDVLAALRKVEARGAIESAHKIKQICGQVFRYAVAAGITDRDVTADLRDALAAVPEAHYAAITDPKQVAELLRAIHGYSGHPAATSALKLAPMVFQRPGELRSMEWAEIDWEKAEWNIPAKKMNKMKPPRDHLVPLSTQAVELLRGVHAITGHGKYVFPSVRSRVRCMSDNTINAALRRMGYSTEVMTAHGFRAMARTIMDEVLDERVDLIEHQLAHAVKDPNGRAYNRTAHLPARHKMMQRWADYLDKLRAGAAVIPLHGSAA